VQLWPPRRRIYVLKCRNAEGKWVELDELDSKISSKDAKDRYEEEIDNQGCTKIKLEEYEVNRDGERIKYVKKHWERSLPKRRALDIDDILGATAFNFVRALESCAKLQEYVKMVAGGGGDDFFKMIEVILRMRGQLPIQPAQQATPSPQAGGHLERVAQRLLEEQAKEFAEADETKAPCARGKGGCVKVEAGEG